MECPSFVKSVYPYRKRRYEDASPTPSSSSAAKFPRGSSLGRQGGETREEAAPSRYEREAGWDRDRGRSRERRERETVSQVYLTESQKKLFDSSMYFLFC